MNWAESRDQTKTTSQYPTIVPHSSICHARKDVRISFIVIQWTEQWPNWNHIKATLIATYEFGVGQVQLQIQRLQSCQPPVGPLWALVGHHNTSRTDIIHMDTTVTKLKSHQGYFDWNLWICSWPWPTHHENVHRFLNPTTELPGPSYLASHWWESSGH